MGVLSVGWYVGLTMRRENMLFDSIASLGLMIAFYYGLTGYACAIYYRHELFKSAKNLILIGVAPVVGGIMLTYVFIKSCDRAHPTRRTPSPATRGWGSARRW